MCALNNPLVGLHADFRPTQLRELHRRSSSRINVVAVRRFVAGSCSRCNEDLRLGAPGRSGYRRGCRGVETL
nr:unnamed protein product [Spirometra erinaceieuropaei]